MMRNSMKLRVALAMSMLVSPVYAGKTVDYACKTAKVAGHAVTAIGGGLIGFCYFNDLKERCRTWCNRDGRFYGQRSLFDWVIDTKCGARKDDVIALFALPLVYSGLSGLDRELLIRERVKQLFDRVMKRSGQAAKK